MGRKSLKKPVPPSPGAGKTSVNLTGASLHPSIRVALVTSAFNEAKNLPLIIAKCKLNGYRLIIVDDGSTDGTFEVACEHGVDVLQHSINLGQGRALITGLRAALRTDADVIGYLDADGQHDPAHVPEFIARMRETKADIVVGSRITGSNHPGATLTRRVMLPYVTWVINRLTGYNMTDAMCGFRCFEAGRLRRFEPVLIQMLEADYMASEMFIRFAHAGFTIEEVPIRMLDRAHGKSTKGLLRYATGVVRAITRALFDLKVRQS
jgi:glycosyltransferase involved in cell wall biosynthesis